METDQNTRMAADLRALAGELFVGIVLVVPVLAAGGPEWARNGFLLGWGVAFGGTLLVVLVRRLRGARVFGDFDERQEGILARAGLWTMVVTVLALGLFGLVASLLPAVRRFDALYLAGSLVTLVGVVFVGSLWLLGRRG